MAQLIFPRLFVIAGFTLTLALSGCAAAQGFDDELSGGRTVIHSTQVVDENGRKQVWIAGDNFGARQEASTVRVEGENANVVSWSDSLVVVESEAAKSNDPSVEVVRNHRQYWARAIR